MERRCKTPHVPWAPRQGINLGATMNPDLTVGFPQAPESGSNCTDDLDAAAAEPLFAERKRLLPPVGGGGAVMQISSPVLMI